MGHDKRHEKVRFFFLKKRFYLGLFILLPAFFSLFSIGAFFVTLEKLEPLLKLKALDSTQLLFAYRSIQTWAYIFTAAALVSGIIVAYSLIRPAKRLLKKERTDLEEFGSLGGAFKDIAISLRQYIAAIEGMTGGVITTNRDGIITTANKQALEMLGPADLLHRDIRKVFLFGEALNKVLGGESLTLEVNALTGGGIRLMDCTASAIRGQSTVQGAVFIFRDISKIKQMHVEIMKTERLASIGSLAMTVAHEIKNPLTSIRGLAQLIAEDIKDDDRKRLYMDIILKEVDRLNRVVDSLYLMRDSTFEGDALREMLYRVRLLCEQAMADKRVTVIERYDETAASREVKDERVFNAIYNVVLNAYEAVEPGGKVIIEATSGDDGIKVDVISESEIKENVPERVFDSDVTTKGKGRGAGLGIAKDAMRQAGGDIELKILEGKTVFRIWLP